MHQHELGYALGLYDDSQSGQVETLRRHCEEAPGLNRTASQTSSNCKNILNYVANIGSGGNVNQMDARYFAYDHMPDSSPFSNLFKYSD